jgi:hypothetical protein
MVSALQASEKLGGLKSLGFTQGSLLAAVGPYNRFPAPHRLGSILAASSLEIECERTDYLSISAAAPQIDYLSIAGSEVRRTETRQPGVNAKRSPGKTNFTETKEA